MGRQEPTVSDEARRFLTEATATDIAALAADWTDDERRILAAVFPALATGQPATAAVVAAHAERPLDEVERVLERRSEMMQHDGDGRIVGWSGLTLQPTRHEVRADGVTLYAWCALDPYFIAPILGRTLLVTSRDPVTEQEVRVRIAPDGSASAPDGAYATLVERGPERLAEDIIANFCDHVHHFPSREAAEAFKSEDVDPVVVGIAEMEATGRALYQRVWMP